MILFRLIEILRILHFADQGTWIQVMGFDQIIEGITMIAQLGIEQTHKQMRVHLKKTGKVHARKLVNSGPPDKPSGVGQDKKVTERRNVFAVRMK